MMQTTQHEKREEERVCAALPIDLGGATGTTRDVSATGVYFETDAWYEVGNEVDFVVAIDTPGGRMMLKAHGNIVRIERHEQKMGIAVKITDSRMEPEK